jgi:hypothetical protein
MLKKCNNCNLELPLLNFHKNKATRDGFNRICKSCKKIKAKESNERCKDRIQQYAKGYKQKYYNENKKELLKKHTEYYFSNHKQRLEYHKQYRKDNKEKINADSRLYTKVVPRQYARRTYISMYNRCYNAQSSAYKFYGGKGIEILMEREEFIGWAVSNEIFLKLLKNYINSNFDFKYAPSIDRINPTKHYSFDNIQWLTVSENSSKKKIDKKRFTWFYVTVW